MKKVFVYSILLLSVVCCTACSGSKKSEASVAQTTESAPSVDEKDQLDKAPTFRGKDKDYFRLWVMQQIRYPEADARSGVQGRVLVRFVIDSDGAIADWEIMRSPSVAMAREVIRIIRSSPKWEPGEKDNEKVRVRITLPVDFKLR
ncbi:energy transducer TonB [Alistipes sp. OttesenSCG-928-L06]|nr:energy transducer TonB [Alistipes sp. OttesenSCG-928-L06]